MHFVGREKDWIESGETREKNIVYHLYQIECSLAVHKEKPPRRGFKLFPTLPHAFVSLLLCTGYIESREQMEITPLTSH